MHTARALGLIPSPQLGPWQKLTVRPGDTLSGLFARAGIGASQWQALLDIGKPTRALRHLRPGDTLAVRRTPDGKLAQLRFRLSTLKTLHVDRDNHRLHARVVKLPIQTRELAVRGTVRRSLSGALARQGAPASVTAQLAHIYHYRHDLRHVQKGDRFAVVYRATYLHGKRIGAGPVLAADITTGAHSYKAFRARGRDGDYAYFNLDGQSYEPAFTRKPVAYTRISSPFNLHRLDPVTHTVRPHKGVDMAAPLGTPIHAAAEGTVKYAAWMHGYGRLVELKNFDGYSTRYAHMHKIRPGLHVGEHVKKGEIIGYVGESGEATGPHLHFEIRRNGVAYNPMTVKLPAGQSLPRRRMAAFRLRIRPLLAELAPQSRDRLAQNRPPHTRQAGGNSCEQNTSFSMPLRLISIAGNNPDTAGNILCVGRPHQHSEA